jgi:hypothetical protein
MLLHDILDSGIINSITEATIRQFKKVNNEIKMRYRCLSGPKKGKIVTHPSKCGCRKDPKKVRRGKKIMRTKKQVIIRKSKIGKRKTISKLISRINKRLSGN